MAMARKIYTFLRICVASAMRFVTSSKCTKNCIAFSSQHSPRRIIFCLSKSHGQRLRQMRNENYRFFIRKFSRTESGVSALIVPPSMAMTTLYLLMLKVCPFSCFQNLIHWWIYLYMREVPVLFASDAAAAAKNIGHSEIRQRESIERKKKISRKRKYVEKLTLAKHRIECGRSDGKDEKSN